MKKTAVIYWSGTGNTEAMANAVAEGMREAGAECAVWTPADVGADAVKELDAAALGCPAMGAEELEETEFAPMFDAVNRRLRASPSACSAPMAGATANGCARGRKTAELPGSTVYRTASSAAKRRMMRRSLPAVRWAGSLPNNA